MAQVTALDLTGVMGRVKSFSAKSEATPEVPGSEGAEFSFDGRAHYAFSGRAHYTIDDTAGYEVGE